MNPELIYTNFRDEALAQTFSADGYTTFVAMPFRDRFSYKPAIVLKDVIQNAAAKANAEKTEGLKEFRIPATVASAPFTANVITEDIVKEILFSTFFVGDLTGGNGGVLIETGIAMSFKPSSQIILITQDPLEQLHFDIRNNRVLNYNPGSSIESLKQAFLSAAKSFENERSRYVTQISTGMSPDALMTLHFYASWYQDSSMIPKQPGLWYPQNIPPFFNEQYGEQQAPSMFQLTLLELYEKRMIWNDYSTKRGKKGHDVHMWAIHVTKLGWLLIKHLWPHCTDVNCERIR